MKCTDCKGTGKYNPLFGPAENCKACNGSGGQRHGMEMQGNLIVEAFHDLNPLAQRMAGVGPSGVYFTIFPGADEQYYAQKAGTYDAYPYDGTNAFKHVPPADAWRIADRPSGNFYVLDLKSRKN